MPQPDDWLGLERLASGHWVFELTRPLSRFDGKLYGGTGLAAVTAAIEAETDRYVLWVTVQFVASVDVGEKIECQVEVLAGGRRTSQVRVTGTVGDRVVLAALGATGLPRTGGLEVQVGSMPDVAPPDDCPRWMPKVPFPVTEGNQGWLDMVDLREVPDVALGMMLWGRMRDRPMSRSGIGFIADLVPSAVGAPPVAPVGAPASTTPSASARRPAPTGSSSTSTHTSPPGATCTAPLGCGPPTAPTWRSPARPRPPSSSIDASLARVPDDGPRWPPTAHP